MTIDTFPSRPGRRTGFARALVLLMALAAPTFTMGGPLPVPLPRNGAEEASTSVWHVEASGSSDETIIFIPGIGSRPWVFDNLRARLEDEYRLVSVTLAGMGGSAPSSATTIARAVEDLRALVQEQPGPVYLVGHSMGGLIALRAAENQLENLAGLIIFDASPQSPPDGIPPDMDDRIARSAENIVPRDEALRFEAIMRWVASMTSPAVRATILEDFTATDPDQLRARLAETIRLLYLLDPGRIGVPVHVLGACVGLDDCSAKLGQFRAVYQGARNLRIEMIEATHFLMLDRPEETAHFVFTALNRHQARR